MGMMGIQRAERGVQGRIVGDALARHLFVMEHQLVFLCSIGYPWDKIKEVVELNKNIARELKSISEKSHAPNICKLLINIGKTAKYHIYPNLYEEMAAEFA